VEGSRVCEYMHATAIYNVLTQVRTKIIPQTGVEQYKRVCRAPPQPPANQTMSPAFSSSSAATSIHAFILNRLDYCSSSLYLGLPSVRLRPLDGVCLLRAAARQIGDAPKFVHIGEFMPDSLPFISFHGSPPHYRVSTFYYCLALRLYPWHCSCLSFGTFCPIFVLSGSAIASLGLSR